MRLQQDFKMITCRCVQHDPNQSLDGFYKRECDNVFSLGDMTSMFTCHQIIYRFACSIGSKGHLVHTSAEPVKLNLNDL